MKLGAKQVELDAKVRAMKFRRDFSQRMHPIHPVGPNTHVLVSFIVFWVHLLSFRNYMKLGAKWSELVQIMRKLVPRSHAGIFLYEHTKSTPLDPKLMFW